jgi:hypothetical protein
MPFMVNATKPAKSSMKQHCRPHQNQKECTIQKRGDALPTDNTGNLQTKNTGRQVWEPFADELRKTHDVQRIRELIMLLEEAIFNRQQELALNADKIDKGNLEDEEQALRRALDLMLEMKVKKLGFPEIR